MLHSFLDGCHRWWSDHPALLYGLALLLGYAAVVAPGWHLAPPAVALWLPLVPALSLRYADLACRLLLAALLAASACLYASYAYPPYTLPARGLTGTGTFAFHSLERQQRSYGAYWLYRGTLTAFTAAVSPPAAALPADVIVTVPVRYLPDPPPLTHRWQITGTLRLRHGTLAFVPEHRTPWQPVGTHWSGTLASWRHDLRVHLLTYLHTYISSPRASPFLYGMLTGIFDNAPLRHHLSRFGIQHLLAISGFHFAIVAASLALLLRLFLPRRLLTYPLLALLTLYCAFLGSSPSILRSWLSASLVLVAYLLRRRSSSLNLLGVSLCLVLAYDPLYLSHVGFHMSFAITASILLFTPHADSLLQRLSPSRHLSHVTHWDSPSQHAYIASSLLRRSLALTLAVTAASLPLTLFHFHSHPWLSLLYNLFFPFLASLSILLFFTASLLHASITPLGTLLHYFNNSYTHYLMGLATHAPPSFNWNLYLQPPAWLISLYLTCLACMGAILYLNTRTKQIENRDQPLFFL